MPDCMKDDRLRQLAAMVRERYGLYYAPGRWNDLRQAVKNFNSENDKFPSTDECLNYIVSAHADRKDLEKFVNCLTIGETYFFRDPRTLDALERDVLHVLNGKGSGMQGAVRIWSAACATGEEPYTLAMICRRAHINCEIFGTDIDSRALAKAHEGLYRKWAFRSACLAFREVFFSETANGSFLIDPAIKSMVKLSRLNLIGDDVPSALTDMNIVFCRNVLMYFSKDAVKLVLDKIWKSLMPGGLLIVAPSESALITGYGCFESVHFGEAVFFRKNEQYEPQSAICIGENESADDTPFEFEVGAMPSLTGDDVFHEAAAEYSVFADESISESVYTAEAVASESLVNVSLEGLQADVKKLRAGGRNAEAVELIDKHIKNDCYAAHKGLLFYGIAEIKADCGFMDEAEKWCRKALKNEISSAQAHFLLGQIMLQSGKDTEAIRHVRNAIFLDSAFVMAHVVLGNIYMQCDDKLAAKRHFRIAIQELGRLDAAEVVPYSDGTTAGRLLEMVRLVQSNLG